MQPANYPAEYQLLAGFCNFPNSYFDYAEHLSTEDFTHPAHASLFTVIQSIVFGQTPGKLNKTLLLAKAVELGIKDFYELCDNGELLDACFERVSSEEDIQEAFYQIKKETVRRKLIETLGSNLKYLRDPGEDNVDQLIQKIENDFFNTLNKLAGINDNKLIELNKSALDIIDELAKTPGEIGLDLGFPLFQKGIGGIRNGAVTFIAASAKTGKSMLGMHTCLKAAQKGLPVLYCDSELNETVQSVRALGGYLGINFSILETGWWSKNKEEIVKAGYSEAFAYQCELAAQSLKQQDIRQKFSNLKLDYLNINGMTVQEALPLMRRWVIQKVGFNKENKFPQCLIVWDYIKLARVDEIQGGKLGVHDVLGAATAGLHDFAEKYNLPIIAFGQTNRMSHNEGINCIAGAKKIVELTDSCSILRAKNQEELLTYPKGTHALEVIISRFGPGYKTHIDLETDLGTAHFKEIGLGSQNMINVSVLKGNNEPKADSEPKDRRNPKQNNKS